MKVEMQLGSENLSIETGKVAKQADGAVWVQYGGTVVLVAVVADRRDSNLDFFPLTVDYREKSYAAGRIPGVYGRREPRPGGSELLTARLIDHCIRPLFPKDFQVEVQVMCTVLASDQIHPADVPALIGTSAALSISDIPFNGPVGAVTIGRLDGEFCINPTYEELERCELEFFVSGTNDAVMSVEGGAHEVPEDEVIDAIVAAHEEIKEITKLQEGLVALCGKPAREYKMKEIDEGLNSRIRNLATERIRESIGMDQKQDREGYLEQVQADILSEILEDVEVEEDGPEVTKDTMSILGDIEKEEMRQSILNEGKRVDGRGVTDIREISGEVGVLPRVHGSSLFTRGQTQALCVTTLGTKGDEDVNRTLTGEVRKYFFLHYNFPPYSTGEVKRIMGPGRREIGHGALAERAIQPVIPGREEFRYTIRAVSEILESNASSSMASVCGVTLSLLDAGVPIKKPVAGVGVGLIKEGDREVILTDMLGTEDFLGDMDFKVAGTPDGITAIQMDIKIDGVTPDLMRRAIHQAKDARMVVLDKMNEVIDKPRDEISPHAPRIYEINISPSKIKDLIGPRGKTVQAIQEETGVTIDIEDDGRVELSSFNAEAANKAEEMILSITAIPEVGKEYAGKVTRITGFGAFIEIIPGQDGLLHISQMGDGYVRQVEDVMNIGDEVAVRVIEIDDQGRVDLTLASNPVSQDATASERGESRDRGDSRPRDNRSSRGPRDGRNSRHNRNSDSRDRRPPRIPKGRF
ncbi:polyribonucleotide nucleotidyltransferase [Candidatus Poribacteria bacterium]|nr:MAG: polyribonucleotide nucleotidyltransferase [Candidatus Poribacteria bacterium]